MPAPMPALIIRPAKLPGWLSVAFKYHPAMVEIVRRLPKRKFDGETKTWDFEASRVAVQALQGTGAHITLENGSEDLWYRGGGVASATPAPKQAETPRFKLDVSGSKAQRKPLPDDFKFITLPMIKQRECMEYLCANPKFYLNMEVGTGKTKLYIDRARLGSHRAKRPMNVLFVGPNNKVPDYGKNELPKHAGKGNFVFLDARGGQRKWEKACVLARQAFERNKGHKGPYIVAIGLNWESLEARTRRLPDGFFDVLILDEAHNGKTPTTGQGKAAKRLAMKTPVVLEGSGTPCTKGPADLWNQITMLMPHLLPSDFTSHRRRYEIQELVELPAKRGGAIDKEEKPRRFLQTTGYQNLYELRDAFLQCSFSATQDECLDLPGVIPERRYVQMSEETRFAYEEVRKNGVLLLSPDQVCLADNAGVEMLRAQQICGGFIGLTDLEGRANGKAAPVPGANAKLDYLVKELIPELMESKAGRQGVLWAVGRAELAALEQALRGITFTDPATMQDRKLRVCSLWGDTPKSERENLDQDFREGKYDWLVSNPQSGGTGLEFQTADVEIYYTRSFKLIHRQQAEGRLNRLGQKNKVLRIDLMYEDSIEEYVLEVLESRRDLQDLLTGNPRSVLKQAFQEYA